MHGLRKAYRKQGDKKRGEDLVRTYARVGWGELKQGDVVVLYEPDGTPVEDGIEHHLIEDPWIEPDLHIHVIKTADPVRVIHKEASHEPVAEQAGAGAVLGEDQAGVPGLPRAVDRGDVGEVSGVFEQADREGAVGGTP
jgi:hypothetical protein